MKQTKIVLLSFLGMAVIGGLTILLGSQTLAQTQDATTGTSTITGSSTVTSGGTAFSARIITPAGTAEVKQGANTVTKFVLKNVNTAETAFDMECKASGGYFTEMKTLNPDASFSSFITDATGARALGSLTLLSGSEKEIGVFVSISTAPVDSSIDLNCKISTQGRSGEYTSLFDTIRTAASAVGTSTTPVACQLGQKCPRDSWCYIGYQCFYPDRQIECVQVGNRDTSRPDGSPLACPSGTTACPPGDTTGCVEPGQSIPYDSSVYKRCAQGTAYYSQDGKTMKCVGFSEAVPEGYITTLPSAVSQSSSQGTGQAVVQPQTPSGVTGTTSPVSNQPSQQSNEQQTPQQQISSPVMQYGEIKDCGLDETPSPGFTCRIPIYRWNIVDKKWEKCDSYENTAFYTPIKGNLKATHTNCEQTLEFEKEWKAERFMLHDPRVDGEWYMSSFNAAGKFEQYDPLSNTIGECKSPAVTGFPAICMTIPEQDRGWLLKKFRADYKHHILSTTPRTPQPKQQSQVPAQTPPQEQFPVAEQPVLEIPASQCKAYVSDVKQTVIKDRQFLKDTNVQFAQLPPEYAEINKVKQLLVDSGAALNDLDKAVAIGKCVSDAATAIENKLDALHNEIFPELSGYIPKIQAFLKYQQCVVHLESEEMELRQMIKDLVGDSKTTADKLLDRIDEFLKSSDNTSSECNALERELSEKMAPILRFSDKEINRIIEDVVARKLEPVAEKLAKDLEEKGKQIDELYVRIAKVQESLEKVTKIAEEISEKITVSYAALSRIEDKFDAEKQSMESAKERILPLIEQATQIVQQTNCVRGALRDQLLQEFGSVASVNWLGTRSEEIEKRLAFFMASCQAKSVISTDVSAFTKLVEVASIKNLEESYELGLTPFKEVPTHEWYYGAMLTGSKTGFVTQGRPADNVLRQDALLMILRVAGFTDKDLLGKCVVPSYIIASPYALCAIQRTLENGLVLDGEMTIPIERGEVASWITALIQKLPAGNEDTLKAYSDLKDVSPEWILGIRTVVANGLMVGRVRSNSSVFQPYEYLTRASLAVILEQLLAR